MATATVTSKGRVTLPVEIRKALAIEAGDRLEFISIGDGTVMMVTVTKSIANLKGRFARPDKPVTIKDMNAAIADRTRSSPILQN